MREIKFRGKRTDTKEWVYGYYAHTTLSDEAFSLGNCMKHHLIIDSGVYYEVIPESVGQYTGLKDKNDKEIYEGDIVNHKNPKPFKDSIYKVEFLNGGFAIKNSDYTEDLNEFLKYSSSAEVIGNIYEN